MYPGIFVRSVTYLFITVLTLFIFKYALPIFVPTAKGIVLPEKIKSTRASDVKDIRLLPFSPKKFQNLGQINIEIPIRSSKEDQERVTREAENHAKKLASELGANAVVVVSYGITSFGDAAPDSNFYVFRGIAIHLDKTL